jgi:hypothetical protein
MLKFYRSGGRIAQPRTFIDRFNPPENLRLVQENVFPHFRPGLTLFWSLEISRYMLYKEWNDKYVLLGIIDSPNLEYREPGEWLLWLLRAGDILKCGNLDPAKALAEYEKELDAPTETERDRERNMKDLQSAMVSDWNRLVTGKTGVLFGQTNRPIHAKVKKNKVIFGMRQSNGKLYKLQRKKYRA